MIPLLLLALTLPNTPTFATEWEALGDPIDDSELTATSIKDRHLSPSRRLQPDRVETTPLDDADSFEITVRIVSPRFGPMGVGGLQFRLPQGERLTTDSSGKGRARCSKQQTSIDLSASLKTDHFTLEGDHGNYELQVRARCGTQTLAELEADSASGQAVGIFRVFQTAHTRLNQTVDSRFWDRSIRIRWPSSSDFYSWGTVHLTRGDHWDVVGHELGHAIYHLARIGRSQGGAHRIDQCYTGTLALSEGWASYFSAWLHLDLTDPRAQFEFMVPRRAPIQIEHIPADVCPGPTNEWRVSSFFWDLIDLHHDGEGSEATFRLVWDALKGSLSQDVREVSRRLLDRGADRDLLALVWNLNFQTEYTP